VQTTILLAGRMCEGNYGVVQLQSILARHPPLNLFGNVAFASTGIMPTAPERTRLALQCAAFVKCFGLWGKPPIWFAGRG